MTSKDPMELAAKVAEKAAKKLLYEVVLTAVIKKLVTAVPLLGTSFFMPIVNFIVFKIADRVWEEASLMGAFLFIDFKTASQRANYEHATNELKDVLALPESEQNEEIIKQAKEEYKRRLAALVRLNS